MSDIAGQTPPRDAVVDALRVLALLPVVAINWAGYVYLPDGGPLGPPRPAGSLAAEAVSWLLFALVAGKGLSLLAFLFGYGQALSARRHGTASPQHRARRMRRLLGLGLLHGCLLYMGDILTLYALSGLVMLRWSGLRLRQLRRRLLLLLGLELLLLSVGLGVLLTSGSGTAPVFPGALSMPSGWLEWIRLNAGHFLATQLGFILLGLPMPLLLMTAGLMAARLRLFTHARWRPALRRWAQRWQWPALALNLAWTTLQWPQLRQGDAQALWLHFALYLLPTWLLLSAWVPRLVLGLQDGSPWLRRLAPAGRHTLSLYLLSSVLSLLLFSGAGLAWAPGTVVVTLLALGYWGGWLMVAPALGRRRLPPEAWLAR